MGLFAQAEDLISSWLGDDNLPAETEKIEVWIDRAERLLNAQIPSLISRVEEKPQLKELAKDVVISMLTRLFNNPQGVRTFQETTGPWSMSTTYAGDSIGSLVVLPEELTLLGGSPRLGTGRAMSIDITNGVWK